MCEVTTKNFKLILPQLKEVLKAAKFISLDTEFSCLTASRKFENSLFDSGNERYAKLRATVEQMIPLQIGLSAFIFDPDNNSYKAHVYTFYIFPRSFTYIDVKFLCQSSSLQFLNAYNFNFNKLINEGISYLNRTQEEEIIKRNGDFTVTESSMRSETENLLEENIRIINEWFADANVDDLLILESVEKVQFNLEIKYFLHKELRYKFKKLLWTYEDEQGFKVQKVTTEQFEILSKKFSLDQTLIADLLGFSEIFRLLTTLQKPIIGHNLLLDLMVITHSFERPLPKSYAAFKKLVHSLFPNIYDTKCISFDINNLIPENKRLHQNILSTLYEYFKDGYGRHLAKNSPLIEHVSDTQQMFHYAGWDAYCTGYIFIRMAHIYASERYNKVKGKKFMSSELLQAVEKHRNNVNIIRGDVSHIRLDGDDPVSRRPPWLIIETKNKPINVNQVTSLLGMYGYVEVKPHSFKGRSAIIAVDNFGSARRILRQFNSHSDFKIQQYNPLKHSPVAGAVLWSSFLISGIVLAWYGYSKIK
ncbi:hypothetical protein ILUMI_08378 [Ignelater luminosus]|uniref:Pre-piRNA 3'-exonuclease trimmer-like n=1 Tax=Ignelater luminosus TaxID=2038154 RepID=A0A8K0D5R9_IGNLU|nr:hypothetical protein ILUMI_08378 [Ignelater luminosus]